MSCHPKVGATICQGTLAECANCEGCGPEGRLRALWDSQGVPKERQDEVIESVTEAARLCERHGLFIPGGAR